MRGKRAREQRRQQVILPPELKQTMKNRLAVVAAERDQKVGAARKERNQSIRQAHEAYGRLAGAAREEYLQRKAAIVAEFEKRALDEAEKTRRAA